MRITWLSAEMGSYTSGGANHNRLFIEYLRNHPEIEKITIVRWPTPEKRMILPEIQRFNGIDIYSPIIKLELKNAINSFKKVKINIKEKLKFAFLRLFLKLKGFSTYDSTKIYESGLIGTLAVLLLSLETPFPNPFWKTVAKYIENSKPDIIQSQVEHLSISGALAREQAKGHLSFQYLIEGCDADTKKGTLEYEFANRMTEALNWVIESDKTDLFLPVSESVEKYLIKHKADQNKIKIIHSPIELKKFPFIDKQSAREKLGLPKHKKIILSIGRMMPRKRYEDIIEILKKLPNDVILYIKRSSCISDDIIDTSKNLISLIKKYKLSNRVIIDDKELPYEQMVHVYTACDVAVYPFLEEPFGMCATEAMASSRPLIVYDSGYLPHFIKNNGFIVKPLDLEDLYQKTKLLLDDEELAKEMGEKGRELAQTYDINVLGEKLVNLYREFL
ncbi:MAG: glycosyltransferase family 4 protein [Candidatus Hodarchaeota archaeon]